MKFHAYNMEIRPFFPSSNDYDAFIIGPTPISANYLEKHKFLKKECNFLEKVIKSQKPVLGVCCGGQILAKRLGAPVVKSPRIEVGGYEVTLTEIGKKDRLFTGFPECFPVFQWHSEMFHVPPGRGLLAQGDSCPTQAFGYKNIRGILFHLEITHLDIIRWIDAYPQDLEDVGKTKSQVIEECRTREPEMRTLMKKLMDNFLDMILE